MDGLNGVGTVISIAITRGCTPEQVDLVFALLKGVQPERTPSGLIRQVDEVVERVLSEDYKPEGIDGTDQ